MDKRKIKLVIGAIVLAVLAMAVVYMNFLRSPTEYVDKETASNAVKTIEEGLKEEPPPPPPPPVNRHGTATRKE